MLSSTKSVKNQSYKVTESFQNSSLRADMAMGEEDESGFTDGYYDLNSDIVQAQAEYHGEY